MNRFKFWLFEKIEYVYLKLKTSLQSEILRAERLKGLADGQRLWEKFRSKFPYAAGSAKDALYQQKRRLGRDLSTCRHLKGGNLKTSIRDYAVYGHTFPDGSQRIKCTICPKAWYPTNSDWKDALEMTEMSTNSWSSSEVVVERKK